MIVRPIVGEWQVPRIERIQVHESRRLRALAVPGLSGDLHQDLGRGAMRIEISGSLAGDEARDQFLADLRAAFNAGDPVDFVADILTDAELEQVLIESFAVEEVAASADTFRYRIVLAEYTEPPEPPALAGIGDDFGLDVDLDAGLDALAGLDLLDIPSILGNVPQIGELFVPVREGAAQLRETLGGAGDALLDLDTLFG